MAVRPSQKIPARPLTLKRPLPSPAAGSSQADQPSVKHPRLLSQVAAVPNRIVPSQARPSGTVRVALPAAPARLAAAANQQRPPLPVAPATVGRAGGIVLPQRTLPGAPANARAGVIATAQRASLAGAPAAASTASGVATQRPKSPEKAPAMRPERYKVMCAGDGDEAAVKTLGGTYVEVGANCGRKVLKKQDIEMSGITVLLYYWDARDGDAFKGWWFGNKLGGQQVWSHCQSDSQTPPKTGWKIPWDGEVRDTMSVEPESAHLERAARESLKGITDEVTTLQLEAKALLEKARLGLQGGDTEAIGALQKDLAKKAAEASEFGRKVAVIHASNRKSGSEHVLKVVQELGSQVREIQSSLNKEYANARTANKEAEANRKLKEQESADMQVLEEFLPEVTSKVNDAEDEIEKAVITTDVIGACDDESMVKEFMKQTQAAADQAQTFANEAMALVEEKLSVAHGLTTETARQRAIDELEKLQAVLQEGQGKLAPLRTIRQDWDRKRRAEKMVSEVEQKMVLAEIELDRAKDILDDLLKAESLNKDSLTEGKAAVKSADDSMGVLVRFVDSRRTTLAGGPGQQELESLDPRLDAAKEKQAKCQESLRNANDKFLTDTYLKEARLKLVPVDDCLMKLEKLELKAQEKSIDDGVTDVLADAKLAEGAANKVQQASSMARMYIETKLVEVKRLTSEAGTAAVERFQGCQEQLEQALKRTAEIRASTVERKIKAMAMEVSLQVSGVEDLVKKMKEAAAMWSDDSCSEADLKASSEQSLSLEKDVTKALGETRKLIASRQIEAKGSDGSAELSNELKQFQLRLTDVQVELSKHRKLFSTVEQRMKLKQALAESEKKLQGLEEKTSETERGISELADLAPDEDGDKGPAVKAMKAAELSIGELQIAVREISRGLEQQARANSQLAHVLMKGILARVKLLQERVQSASASLKKHSEDYFVKKLIKEAEKKQAECNEVVDKAVDEASAIETGSTSDTAQAAAKLTGLEKLIQAAVVAVSGTKTDMSMKRLSLRRIASAAGQRGTEALTTMIGSLEGSAEQLTKLRSKAAEDRKLLFQRSREAKR